MGPALFRTCSATEMRRKIWTWARTIAHHLLDLLCNATRPGIWHSLARFLTEFETFKYLVCCLKIIVKLFRRHTIQKYPLEYNLSYSREIRSPRSLRANKCCRVLDFQPLLDDSSIGSNKVEGDYSIRNYSSHHNWIGKGLEDGMSRIGSNGGEEDNHGYCYQQGATGLDRQDLEVVSLAA